YLPQDVAVGKSAVQIVIADTLVALIAGLVVFPMVFANGLDPSAGTGLIFQTLPVAFSQMPYGSVVAVLFFLLLSVAAVTSMVGLTEPLVGFLMERLQCSRRRATALVIGVLFAVSLISVLSYNHWQHVGFAGRSLAAWLDYIPNQVMLPLGGLLLALFAGWILNRQIAEDELAMASSKYVGLWRSLLRWLAVPAVAIILLTGL
ncbi:MAG TPA: sodium-dependent transporter, partial [Gammaproteobacteria bacterium]|nr:sodium-dependent transporter [Gammaproteobacteria bacterium]